MIILAIRSKLSDVGNLTGFLNTLTLCIKFTLKSAENVMLLFYLYQNGFELRFNDPFYPYQNGFELRFNDPVNNICHVEQSP